MASTCPRGASLSDLNQNTGPSLSMNEYSLSKLSISSTAWLRLSQVVVVDPKLVSVPSSRDHQIPSVVRHAGSKVHSGWSGRS